MTNVCEVPGRLPFLRSTYPMPHVTRGIWIHSAQHKLLVLAELLYLRNHECLLYSRLLFVESLYHGKYIKSSSIEKEETWWANLFIFSYVVATIYQLCCDFHEDFSDQHHETDG